MSSPICPKCGKKMKLRSGKFGQFWGCTGYPSCRWTQEYEEPSVTAESCKSGEAECFGCELHGTDGCHMLAAFGG